MNIIDKIYRAISPVKALEREKARTFLSQIDTLKNSGYDESGASRRKNSMKGWRAESNSPQEDIDLNLHLLRQRSRSLYMNAPIARGAINTNRTNIVGPGLVLKPKINYKVLGIKKEDAREIEEKINFEFSMWAESKFCCGTHLNNFAELQQITMISWLINGDSFAIPYYAEPKPYMPYQLRIKLVEADRIATPGSDGEFINLNYKTKQGNRIYNGVELDESGAVTAYHLCNKYPSDYSKKGEWTRIEACGEKTGNPNVIHVFNAERPEQYRGVPYLAPVIETLKQITRYTEAELMAAVINGIFSIFITTEDGIDSVDFAGIDGEEDAGKNSDENDYKLGNGIINYLAPGEKIQAADATRPNVNFEKFTDSLAKYIGTALEVPKDLLLKEFSNSYSASRAALLESWKAFRMRRKWFADDFCQPIYELWLSEAVAKNRIHAPGFFTSPVIRKAYCGAVWNGPAPGQLDPIKEAGGAALRVKHGFSTHEREAVEINGSDFDYNVGQLEDECKKMCQAGLFNNEAQIRKEGL